MELSVIVPAFNEEKRLPVLLEQFNGLLRRPEGRCVLEIIVVDDGSTDGTAGIVRRAAEADSRIRLVGLAANSGKGAAVKKGVFEAAGGQLVFLDADGATSADELPKMADALSSSDIVVGDRWSRDSKVFGQSPLRAVSSRLIRAYMSCFGLGGIDTMCGFKGFRTDVARKLFADLRETRWLFDQEILYRARLSGYRIESLPIAWTSMQGSKVKLSTLASAALRLPAVLLRAKKDVKNRQ